MRIPNLAATAGAISAANMANNDATISAIAMAPSDPNTIFAGTEDGRVFKTTNAGNDCNPNCPTWTEVDTGLPSRPANHGLGNRVRPIPTTTSPSPVPSWAETTRRPTTAASFHVWIRNGGAWSPINGNLPNEAGRRDTGRRLAPATPVLYLGTLRGAYMSTNLGTTWTRIDSLPRTQGHRSRFHAGHPSSRGGNDGLGRVGDFYLRR